MSDQITRIKELENNIRAADHSYFIGEFPTVAEIYPHLAADYPTPPKVVVVEDATYDGWKEELKKIDPENALLKKVGEAASEMFVKVQHAIPMGSLDKAMNETEFMAWVKTLPPGTLLTASLKMDGGSASVEYSEGNLVRGVTRGDGLIGEDITNNVLHFKNLPKKNVKFGDVLFTGFIRGEIMLLTEDWKKIDPDFLSNPRNRGNGLSRRKDGEDADLLTLFAFRAYNRYGTEIAGSEEQMFQMLEAAGFTVAPFTKGTTTEIWDFFQKTYKERPTLPFWIDGITVKIDDIAVQGEMGVTDQRPKGQIAIKFPAEGALTTLRSVELSIGHTGAIIPTGKFDPVQLGGTTVSSALLCNWPLIHALDIAIGDDVTIYKAGDIIPKVKEVIARPSCRVAIPEPTQCPACAGAVGHKTGIDGEESVLHYCLNEECPAKIIGKIDRYIRSLNILGIGDEVLAALCKRSSGDTPGFGLTSFGPLLKSADDLYVLKEHKERMANLLMGGKTRLGEKRTAKILDEIEKKRELTLAEFLGSLGVAGLGKKTVQNIQEAVPGEMDLITDWTSGKLGQPSEAESQMEAELTAFEETLDHEEDDEGNALTEEARKRYEQKEKELTAKYGKSLSLARRAGVPGVGKRISDDVVALSGLISDFFAKNVRIKLPEAKAPVNPGAKSFCFTGASSVPRKELQAMATAKGHIVKDDVGKGLDYLVMADPESTSSKAVKARKLGTQCISEEKFRSLIG